MWEDSVSRKMKRYGRAIGEALEEKKKAIGTKHGISIIIPTCFDDEDVRSQVRGLLRQDYPDYEIVIVNGNRKRKIPIRHPKVRVVNEKQMRGRSAARNAGADAARKDILVFLDAKTDIPSRDALGKIGGYLGSLDNRNCILKCRVLHDIGHYGDDFFVSRGHGRMYAYYDSVFNGESSACLDTFLSDFFAIRKEQYGRYPFSEAFGRLWGFEDVDFAAEQQMRGAKIVYTNDIIGMQDRACEKGGLKELLRKLLESGINYREIIEKKEYMRKKTFRHSMKAVFDRRDFTRRIVGNEAMARHTREDLLRLLSMYSRVEKEKKKLAIVPKAVSRTQEEMFFDILDTAVYLGRISIKDAGHARAEAEKIFRELKP